MAFVGLGKSLSHVGASQTTRLDSAAKPVPKTPTALAGNGEYHGDTISAATPRPALITLKLRMGSKTPARGSVNVEENLVKLAMAANEQHNPLRVVGRDSRAVTDGENYRYQFTPVSFQKAQIAQHLRTLIKATANAHQQATLAHGPTASAVSAPNVHTGAPTANSTPELHQ